MDLTGSGQGPVAGCCEHGKETLCSIEGRECLDQLGDSQILKKDSVPRRWLIACLASCNGCERMSVG